MYHKKEVANDVLYGYESEVQCRQNNYRSLMLLLLTHSTPCHLALSRPVPSRTVSIFKCCNIAPHPCTLLADAMTMRRLTSYPLACCHHVSLNDRYGHVRKSTYHHYYHSCYKIHLSSSSLLLYLHHSFSYPLTLTPLFLSFLPLTFLFSFFKQILLFPLFSKSVQAVKLSLVLT